MEFVLPLYAVQRLANGQWLVRTQMGDPILPSVDVVVGGRPARLSARAGDHGRRYTNTAGLTSHMCPRSKTIIVGWDGLSPCTARLHKKKAPGVPGLSRC